MKLLRRNIFPLIVILISVILAATNYTYGTILSGWDTLHPEFNFPEYFKRILFGVWESHQGLGALSTQAHPSEFPRMFLYYPLSFILPFSFLRYSYFFLTLIMGPLGMYFFLKKAVLKEESLENKIASFGGALFYLFNLGTIQHYFVPLEMFATHFATLPWLFLFLVQYIQFNRKKDLILFAIFTFFSGSIAHTPTLWFAYLFSLILFLSVYNFINRKKEIRKNSLIIILLTFLINAYWLLPNLYFIFTQGNQIGGSKIHSLFTEEAFANNKLYGTISDILILKNFLFNWSAYFPNGEFGPLLKVWINHLQQPLTLIIGYGLSAIALIGLTYSVFKKNIISLSLLTISVLSIFFLLTDNPPFGFIFNFLQDEIPLFKEAIRFPFTKFSILLMFALSCYFTFGLRLLIKRFSVYSFVFIFVAFLYYMLPAFQGNLISPLMKVNIPTSYFSVFDLLNNKPYGRIATLPIHSFWGWNYYSWPARNAGASVAGGNYQGAGFTWFGLKDPVLEREFDRWNPANEQYYREMSQAIYSQNQEKLDQVLKKYDISYILWDKSIVAPEQSQDKKVLFLKETKNLLKNDPNLTQIAQFEDLSVYQVRSTNPQVRVIKNPISIAPKAISYDDVAFARYSDYITSPNLQENSVFYPFRDIIDNQNRVISKDILTALKAEDPIISGNLSLNIFNECAPIDPKETINFQKNIIFDKLDNFSEYSSLGGSFCEHYSFPTLPRNKAYLVSIDSRNLKGLPLRVCVNNYISKRCDLYAHLAVSKDFTQEVFLIPPIDNSMGFDISINNFSVRNNPSINDVKAINIFPFDYERLSQIENYTPKVSNEEKDVLVYSQSYDPGWKAYEIKAKNSSFLASYLPFFFGKELKNHVLVNNWANGWVLDSNSTIKQSNNQPFVIIYWPQYLEYLGLGLLIITFIWIIFFKKHY